MATDPNAAPVVQNVQEVFYQLLSLIPMAKTAEILEEIATSIDIDFTAVAGDRAALVRLLMLHLNSANFDNEPDREDLILENFDRLQDHLGFKTPKPDPNAGITGTPPAVASAAPQVSQPPPGPATAGPAATGTAVTIIAANPVVTPSSASQINTATTMTSSVLATGGVPTAAITRLKDFKIDGLIGSKDPAKRLIYTSLQHQVDSARRRGYLDPDIIAAVIRCIPPGSSTRTYLEGRGSLSIDMLLTTLRAHFVEGKVTTLYEKLTHSVQGVDDSPLTFLMDSFALRDQILDLSLKQQDTDARYGRSLVQNVMQETLFTGLRDEGIRQHLRPFLAQKDVADDVLIGEVTKAALEKESRDAKFGLATVTKKDVKVKVASVDSTLFSAADHDEKFLAQIKDLIGSELKGQMGPLKAEVHNLRQEVARVSLKRKPNAVSQASHNAVQHQLPLSSAAAPLVQNSPIVTPGSGANITTDDFIDQMFARFQARGLGGQQDGYQGNGNYRGRGGGRGGRGGGSGGRGGGRNCGSGGNPSGKCSQCRDANAVFCNHCLVCHEVTHYRSDCPKKDDPNWTPLN